MTDQEEKDKVNWILGRLCATVFHIQNDELKPDEVTLVKKWVGDDWEEKVNALRNSGQFFL